MWRLWAQCLNTGSLEGYIKEERNRKGTENQECIGEEGGGGSNTKNRERIFSRNVCLEEKE
jgi:hypothetical protein